MAPPDPTTEAQEKSTSATGRSPVSRFTRSGTDAKKLLRRAEWVTVAASLLWIAQAAAASFVLANLVSGSPNIRTAISGSMAFVLVGILRAVLSHAAGAAALQAAQITIGRERKLLLEREALRAPLAGGGKSSAEIATLASDKLAMTVPYLTRYRPAMMQTRVMPLAIVLAALPFSWVAALILLITGPVIPMFMALVGMAAKEASERQMEEIGSINGLLLERIRALTDLGLLDAAGRTIDDFRGAADRLHKKTMRVLAVSAVLLLLAPIITRTRTRGRERPQPCWPARTPRRHSSPRSPSTNEMAKAAGEQDGGVNKGESAVPLPAARTAPFEPALVARLKPRRG